MATTKFLNIGTPELPAVANAEQKAIAACTKSGWQTVLTHAAAGAGTGAAVGGALGGLGGAAIGAGIGAAVGAAGGAVTHSKEGGEINRKCFEKQLGLPSP